MFKNIKRLVSITMAIVIMICMFPTVAHAKTDYKTGVAIVTGSSLRLRKSDSLLSKVLDMAEKNDIVVVLDKNGSWYKVNYNLQEGYMHEDYLNFIAKENIELGYGKVSGTQINMRIGPSTGYKSLGMLDNNDLVYIIGINNGWYKVIFDEKIGYIRSDYVELTEIPYENYDSDKEPLFFKNGKLFVDKIDVNKLNANNNANKPVEDKEDVVNKNENPQNSIVESTESTKPSDSTKPVETQPEVVEPEKPAESEKTDREEGDKVEEEKTAKDENVKVEEHIGSGNVSEDTGNSTLPDMTAFGKKIVGLAKLQLGVPYVGGGTTPNGFDCSGFTYYVFNQAGYPLSRIMMEQYNAGTPIEKSELQPGDLVFFQNTYKAGMSHVGIYVGDGMFIHAPSSGKVVSYARLDTAYYQIHYYGACRIVP